MLVVSMISTDMKREFLLQAWPTQPEHAVTGLVLVFKPLSFHHLRNTELGAY